MRESPTKSLHSRIRKFHSQRHWMAAAEFDKCQSKDYFIYTLPFFAIETPKRFTSFSSLRFILTATLWGKLGWWSNCPKVTQQDFIAEAIFKSESPKFYSNTLITIPHWLSRLPGLLFPMKRLLPSLPGQRPLSPIESEWNVMEWRTSWQHFRQFSTDQVNGPFGIFNF